MDITVALDGSLVRNLSFIPGDEQTINLVVYAHDGDTTPIAVTNPKLSTWGGSFLPIGSEFTVPCCLGRMPYKLAVDIGGVTTTVAYGYIESPIACDYSCCFTCGSGIFPCSLPTSTDVIQPAGVVSAKSLGVVGDYATDDTDALAYAMQYAVDSNLVLDLGGLSAIGVYSLDMPAGLRMRGNGPANMQTWYSAGDKLKMRPGYKHLFSGSNIVIKQATKTYVTNRVDQYASFTYGLGYLHLEPGYIDGVGIILDVDVYDADGNMTNRSNDNQVSCDVGLVVRSQLFNIRNCNLFGYWNMVSYATNSQLSLETVDSDYNRAFNTNFTSVAVIGEEISGNGLTGSSFLQCGFYCAADYHVPAQGNYLIPAIFVDGVASGGIRGHRFDGNIRTRSNTAVLVDRVNDIRFDFYVSELPSLAGVPNADASGRIVGTSRTTDVYIGYASKSQTSGWGINALAATIAGRLVSIGGQDNGQLMTARAGSVTRIFNNTVGDSVIQLTGDASSLTSDWNILRDNSSNDNLSFRFDNVGVFLLDKLGNVQADGVGTFDLGLVTGAGIESASGELVVKSQSGSGVRMRSGSTTVALFGVNNATIYADTLLQPNTDNTTAFGSTSRRWTEGHFQKMFLGSVLQLAGAGTPEGVQTAPVGSTYQRTDGGAGTSFYVKESGVGNTGWVGK